MMTNKKIILEYIDRLLDEAELNENPSAHRVKIASKIEDNRKASKANVETQQSTASPEQEVTKEPEQHELKNDNVYEFSHINLEGISGEQWNKVYFEDWKKEAIEFATEDDKAGQRACRDLILHWFLASLIAALKGNKGKFNINFKSIYRPGEEVPAEAIRAFDDIMTPDVINFLDAHKKLYNEPAIIFGTYLYVRGLREPRTYAIAQDLWRSDIDIFSASTLLTCSVPEPIVELLLNKSLYKLPNRADIMKIVRLTENLYSPLGSSIKNKIYESINDPEIYKGMVGYFIYNTGSDATNKAVEDYLLGNNKDLNSIDFKELSSYKASETPIDSLTNIESKAKALLLTNAREMGSSEVFYLNKKSAPVSLSESLRFNKDDSKDIWTFRYRKGTNPFKDSANIVFPKGNTFGIQIKQSYKSSIVKWADIKFKSDSNINQYFEYSSDKESATYKVLVDGLSEHDWELIIEKDRDGNYSLSINFSVTDKQEQKKEDNNKTLAKALNISESDLERLDSSLAKNNDSYSVTQYQTFENDQGEEKVEHFTSAPDRWKNIPLASCITQLSKTLLNNYSIRNVDIRTPKAYNPANQNNDKKKKEPGLLICRLQKEGDKIRVLTPEKIKGENLPSLSEVIKLVSTYTK